MTFPGPTVLSAEEIATPSWALPRAEMPSAVMPM